MMWKSSTLHDYGSHGSIRATDDATFPILKLAHPNDALSLQLIEREFHILVDLRKLGVPVVDFDQNPITCDGILYGYRMKELTKLEPGELYTRRKDARDALSLLHRAGYCHGDFHPSNMMKADDGRLILIDFGFSGRIGSPVPPFMPSWRFPTGRYCLDQDIAALEKYALPS
ncbi:Protein kinase-like domain protein [Cordyceps fumosorosea ARSEF 2679]|uniref:non-specific serine/threonine protein kinase n=1 Tax=Cordyceps fumosorosea (strain ARSEF 2679) TaxID=1081104 RepID=A0A167UBD8_CORFA|nr:Protein kinase-like domain protein [Cordyceps fumosorosea ARSEF 2679]OAA61413.1 Protein kinase-like domain protein [Cordyceps fumosorosea ARSEF 2679]